MKKTHSPARVTRYRFLSGESPASPSSPANPCLECFVAPLTIAAGGFSALGLQGARWQSDEAVKQLTRKLKEAFTTSASSGVSKTARDEDRNPRSIQVCFTSGAASSFLFISPEVKTFDLHSELYKTFADPLKRVEQDYGGKIALDLRHLDEDNQRRVLLAFTYLCETVQWEPVRFGRSENSKKKHAKVSKKSLEISIASSIPDGEARAVTARATAMAHANNEVRTLADLPPNELTPETYRARIQSFARSHGLEFEFLDRKALVRRKAGAFLAVTRADPDTAGGIAILKYRPRGKTPKNSGRKRLTLVGKGICFDTGGYNIKSGNYMLGMHGDMTGSALALALCGYFASIQADLEVHAYLALAENLISPTAYKPNEVVVAVDGTAIEVVDTDAEGRMILADTLAIARQGKPDLMIDYATLTGMAIRALDRRKSAVFSNREELAQLAVRCGDSSGERLWYFPVDEDYRKALKSKVADLLQCSESSNADHIYAAAFLSHFAGSDTPWVHVDLVACENKGGLGLIGTDTTGFGVLWTDAFVRETLAFNDVNST